MAYIVMKQYTPKELARKWGKRAWRETPAQIVAIPFPEGVLFGAEQRYSAQRVSFFLSVEDARIIGEKLLAAAREAENAVS
ncbi:hypothetical protein [Rhodobacter maris]|uniref:Uncharacterized protein n=1 Tax=Rhodobacter maris TaxID=446682 RepID=A0A285SWU4_9RHOB|nr:hypothetical protein [Rhodobacter maris]SOC11033.1 hypothetical protein SAMN05877831_108147 [Rhodobacter maris]